MTSRPAPENPRATYRLQLTPDFGFDAAREVLPYLARLGVSHVYLSPCLQAAPGSAHGYDVADPGRIDAARGGEAAFERLLGAARSEGLGVVLDVVPNHLAATEQNPWWWDVLAHGRQSRFAPYFDIDWEVRDPELRGKVLLPILGEPLPAALEQGLVRAVRTGSGEWRLCVHDRELPVSERAVARRLPEAGDLPALLRAQHYVLAFWREGLSRLNWRRFFDVTGLVGVRVEREDVFADVHRRALELVGRGLVAGLRIDHPDGLRDPPGYLVRLRRAVPAAWIVVEKILEPGETLPEDWPVQGTTGYDFLAAAGGLFVDRAAEAELSALCREITGSCPPFAQLRRDKQSLALRELFPAEVARVTAMFAAALDGGATPPETLRRAVEAVAVAMPVYRTYVPERGVADRRDRRWLEEAFARAAADDPQVDEATLLQLQRLLCGDEPGGTAGAELRARFQQLTGPAMAKGLEDTALYCDRRLVCLNEVGGDPQTFGTTRAAFHALCRHLHERWPATMTALSTHDTKRSADVRLRIATLSEDVPGWAAAVREWRRLAARHREAADLPLPGAEYLLYQTLVGCWPAGEERIVAYVRKAAREAKLRTSWLDPDPEYERVLEAFARAVLTDVDIRRGVAAFVARILPAARVHGLSLALLQLTAVGVPDLYQGCEVPRESLTDPDNRRPVEFARLRAELGRVQGLGPEAARDAGADAARLWLTQRTLRLRRERPEAFGAGAPHVPLEVAGADEHRAVAFARGGDLAVVVPRLLHGAGARPLDLRVELPEGRWRSAWDGRPVGAVPDAAELFAAFPVALLLRG